MVNKRSRKRKEINTRLKLPGQDSILNLVRQLDHGIDFLTALFPFPEQFLELLVHSILAAKESVDLVLLDWETSLHRLLTSPVFSVRLSLDEDLPSC